MNAIYQVDRCGYVTARHGYLYWSMGDGETSRRGDNSPRIQPGLHVYRPDRWDARVYWDICTNWNFVIGEDVNDVFP